MYSEPCATSESNSDALQRRPAAQRADPVPDHLVGRVVQLLGLLVGVGDEARRVHADRVRDRAELVGGPPVQVDVRGEALRVAADDGEHERQAVARGAHHRLRRAADADPGGQAAGLGLGEHVGVVQRGAGGAAPGDRLLVQQLHEQLELLLEQHVVVAQVVPEQREGLGERAAPEDHLGTAARDRVHGREALEDPDRVVRAQHRHTGGELDPRGTGGDPGQHGLRGGDRVFRAVVFAERDDVDAEFVGEHRLVDDLPDRGGVRDGQAGVVLRHVAEGVEAQHEIGHDTALQIVDVSARYD